MKQSINFDQFTSAFNALRPDNFSYEGLRELYEYFTDIETETGEQMDLDVITICCEYSELPYGEIARDYDIDLSEAKDLDGNFDDGYASELVLEYLHEHTSVIGVTDAGTIVYVQF